MKSFLVCAILILSFSPNLLAQLDTVITYDVRMGIVDTIVIPPNNSNATFDYTGQYTGDLSGISALSTTAPTQNLFTNTSFQRIERAADHHNLLDYPTRANVKLLVYDNDTLKHLCSGTLVDDNLVLTAGHCAFFQQTWIADSILVAPSYDNGTFNSSLPTSIATKYYIFKSSFDGNLNNDFALIELDQNIGKQLGWLSIAFNADTAYFNNKVFHKFSYPYHPIPSDTISNVNGDTMYYNYGLINYLFPNHFGVSGPDSYGIIGQSGSSLFYSDNFLYQCYGVMSFTNNYNHSWLSKDSFYGLKHIIDNYATNNNESIVDLKNTLTLYPNPASDLVTLKLDKKTETQTLNLSVKDVFGRTILFLTNIGEMTQMDVSLFASGLYILSIDDGSKILATEKLVID